jgi:hypothetical protein
MRSKIEKTQGKKKPHKGHYCQDKPTPFANAILVEFKCLEDQVQYTTL